VPRGTNLGLCHLLWPLLRGRLLQSRGAVIPALAAGGRGAAAVRRAWAARASGRWSIAQLLASWPRVVPHGGHWQAHRQEGFRPGAWALVGCWHPRLPGGPTTPDGAQAGTARVEISLGLLARGGSVGAQRLALPGVCSRPEA
jgi:hypothetical protein